MEDDLLALADAENRLLREEVEELRSALASASKALELLAADNAEFCRRMASLLPSPDEPLLAGLRIGIIGHPSREPDYRGVIERLGGQLHFAGASDKLGLIDRVVQKAHGTVFLTAWASHKAHQRAQAAALRYGRPLIHSDQPGLAMVERLLLEGLLPRIREARVPR